MSAGIEETDHMMSVQEVPWHGLGTILPEIATAREAIEAAKLDWRVTKEPVKNSAGNVLPGWFMTTREDTKQPLGVMGSWYTVLQNVEAFNLFDAVTQDPNGPKYVTAGSLHGGKKVWILAKLPEVIKVTKTDIIDQYILLSHGHDGLTQIRMQYTPVRVVCQNTLSLALGTRGGGIKFKHIKDVFSRVSDIQEALGIVKENSHNLADLTKAMAKYQPSDEEIQDVVASLFPCANEDNVPTRTLNTRQQVLDLMDTGRGNDRKSVRGSAWTLLNAVTEYSDYYRPTLAREGKEKADIRLESVWWGSGAALKSKAFELVSDLVLKG